MKIRTWLAGGKLHGRRIELADSPAETTVDGHRYLHHMGPHTMMPPTPNYQVYVSAELSPATGREEVIRLINERKPLYG